MFYNNEEYIGISTTAPSDEDMKIKILECLGSKNDWIELDDIFGGMGWCLPKSLKELAGMDFLYTYRCNEVGFEADLFLLLNQLFGKTYLAISGCLEDDYDFKDDYLDEQGIDYALCLEDVSLYTPDGLKKCNFRLTHWEVFDDGGGSNGADLGFDKFLGEEPIEKKAPSDSFVEGILEKAKEKGYTDLVDLINDKMGK